MDKYKKRLKEFHYHMRKAMFAIRQDEFTTASFHFATAGENLSKMEMYAYAIGFDDDYAIKSVDDYERLIKNSISVREAVGIMASTLKHSNNTSLVKTVKEDFEFKEVLI